MEYFNGVMEDNTDTNIKWKQHGMGSYVASNCLERKEEWIDRKMVMLLISYKCEGKYYF